MYGSRRFMDEVPMLGRPIFQSLGQQAPITPTPGAQAPAPAPAPAPAGKGCTAARVGTALITLGVGFFALEVTGVTNVTGVRKYLR